MRLKTLFFGLVERHALVNYSSFSCGDDDGWMRSSVIIIAAEVEEKAPSAAEKGNPRGNVWRVRGDYLDNCGEGNMRID